MPDRHVPDLILASGSAIRRQLLENAGLVFRVVPADLDEPALRAEMAADGVVAPANVARELAKAKAVHIARMHPASLVIGADQVLELDGEMLSKAPDLVTARATLRRLAGRRHALHSGVALAMHGRPDWSAVESAHVTLRTLSDADINWYVGTGDPGLTGSVGTYRLEGPGVRLLDQITGDYFVILGLPLLTLLAELRRCGSILH